MPVFIIVVFIYLSFYPEIKGSNVADYLIFGAECIASKPGCHRAIDGISGSASNTYNWQFFGNPVGIFITISFEQEYMIYTARFMQKFWVDEKNFENVDLQFQDGSRQQVTLTTGVDGWLWDCFDLAPVTTTFVTITILSSASTANHTFSAFSEIQLDTDRLCATELTTTTTTTTTTPAPTTTTTSTTSTTTQPTTTSNTPSTTTYKTTSQHTTTTQTTTTPTTTTTLTTTSTNIPTSTSTLTTTTLTTTTLAITTTPRTNTPTTTSQTTTKPKIAIPSTTTNPTTTTATVVSGGLNARDVIISVSVSLCTLVVIILGVAGVCFMWRRSQLDQKKGRDAPDLNNIDAVNAIPMGHSSVPGYQALNFPQTSSAPGQSRPTTAVYDNLDVSEYQEIDERQMSA